MGRIVRFPHKSKQPKVADGQSETKKIERKPLLSEDVNYKERYLWLAAKYEKIMNTLMDALMSGEAEKNLQKIARIIITEDSKQW